MCKLYIANEFDFLHLRNIYGGLICVPQWVRYQCSDRHGIHHKALVRTNDGVIHVMKHLLIPVISMYGIFTCKYQVHLLDVYGINVGKYTSPMMGSYGIYS